MEEQLLYYCFQKVNKFGTYPENQSQRVIEVEKPAKLDELPLFDFEVVANATNNFHFGNTLGKGGFGPVYKVVFCLMTLTYHIFLKLPI